jgi:hypothetical protein
MSWDLKDKKRVEQIIKQITGNLAATDDELIAPALLKCSGHVFLWAPVKKTMIRKNCGSKVYIISYEENKKGRILIYDGLSLLTIKPEALQHIGFN